MNIPRYLRHTVWLFLSALAAFGMWYYVAHIWSVGQPANFSDLYARWWGAHELWFHNRDPYSPAVTREIQVVIYGAPVVSERPDDAAELAGGFAYPVYVTFLMWPTLHLPYPLVREMFYGLLIAVTLTSVFLWLYALRWRPPGVAFFALMLFVFGSFPVLQGIKLQNLSLLVAFLLAATLASLTAGYLTPAGFLLACSTIKPQFAFLLVPWLALWVFSDWGRRQKLVWSFSVTVAALVFGGELIDPGWISRFLMVARAYRQYTYGHSLLDVWLTPRVGVLAALLLVVGVIGLGWRCRHEPASSLRFFLASSLVLAATLIVIPTLEPHAQVLLLPGYFFFLKHSHQIWNSGKIERLLLVACWVLPAWAWIASIGMTLAAIWIPASTLVRLWPLPLYTSPLLPLALLVMLGSLLRNETALSPVRGMILES